MSLSFYGCGLASTESGGGGTGEAGRGINSVAINDDGQMVIMYSDGISENIGTVVGKNGYTFYPSITDNTLSWTNDGNLPNPDPYTFTTSSNGDDIWNEIGGEGSDSGDFVWNDIP